MLWGAVPGYIATIVCLVVFLLLSSSVGAAEGKQVKGYVVPIMHQDIGYTDTAQITLEKMATCLATIVPRLEEHSEWCFWWENVYTLKYALARYPDLVPRVRALLKKGQLSVGAEWAGMDAALVPEESLVRTVTLAKNWMRKNLDYEPTVASMNDMSGFGPQMAQVFQKAGVHFFFYTRGWEPPAGNYFHCVGLDGSKVLATKVTAPKEFRGNEDVGYDGFYLFSGLGVILDGIYKGDPTEQELEGVMLNLVRFNRAFDENEWPGGIFWGMLNGGGDNRCPNLDTVNSMVDKWNRSERPEINRIQFRFGSLDRIARATLRETNKSKLENWIMHVQPWPVQCRQERTFYYLSRAEANLLAAEKIASLCEILGMGGYPMEDLENLWGEKVLWVYDHNWGGRGDSGGSDFEKMRSAREGMELSETVLRSRAKALASAVKYSHKKPVVVFNTLNWPRTDVAEVKMELPAGQYRVVDEHGRQRPCSITRLGKSSFAGRWLHRVGFVAEGVPSFGYKTYYVVPGRVDTKRKSVNAGKGTIENEFFKIQFSDRDGIKSIRDKRLKKELVEQDSPVRFGQIVSEDVRGRPKGELDGDPALDATSVITDTLKIAEVKTYVKGSLGAEVLFHGRIEDSPVTVTLGIWKSIPRIDMKVEMDYSGVAPRLIYLCLPLAVGSEWKNTIGVSFGAMDNPVLEGTNSSAERVFSGGFSRRSAFARGHIGSGWTDPTKAKFAQKWTDMMSKDKGWGVTVVLRDNHTPVYRTDDCLYVGLLRSLTGHDADTKKTGYHSYEFSLVPHLGDWKRTGAYRRGWEGFSGLTAVAVDKSLRLQSVGFLPESYSFLHTSKDNIVVTALKKGFDRDSFILRYYEAADTEGEVEIEFGSLLRCVSAEKVNLLEEPVRKLRTKKNALAVDTNGYTIRTLKLDIEATTPKAR
jgi:alpha-mannosidase